jgi:F0F1-type ATP synthase assembly protein I
MSSIWMRTVLILIGLVAAPLAEAAVDSYRFAHVTISTPWYIFIFLLMGIFAPFVLMVVLAWRNAVRKATPEIPEEGRKPSHQ